MADFSVRSDSVNVEQIMDQIRTRIREKRGVDYTEQQIRELAAVKLEKFLDPRGVRSDLLEQFRKAQPAYEPPELPNFAFEDATLFESHRAPIRWLRKLLLPILKLFFNPNPLIQALHIQSRLNTMNAEREARREAARRQLDQLYYELIHNLVLETTRLGIDVKNLKMRLESVSSRLEFNERRARALESVVVYKPSDDDRSERHERPPRPERGERPGPRHQQQGASQQQRQYTPPQPQPTMPTSVGAATVEGEAGAATGQLQPAPSPGGPAAEGPGQRSRRRRRRRGRRGGGPAAAVMGAQGAPGTQSPPTEGGAAASSDSDEASEPFDEAGDEGADDRRAAPEPAPTVTEQPRPAANAGPEAQDGSTRTPEDAAGRTDPDPQ
jgi:hypothetical protein